MAISATPPASWAAGGLPRAAEDARVLDEERAHVRDVGGAGEVRVHLDAVHAHERARDGSVDALADLLEMGAEAHVRRLRRPKTSVITSTDARSGLVLSPPARGTSRVRPERGASRRGRAWSCPRPRTSRRAAIWPAVGGQIEVRTSPDRTAREPEAALADRDRDLELGRLEVGLIGVLALEAQLRDDLPGDGRWLEEHADHGAAARRDHDRTGAAPSSCQSRHPRTRPRTPSRTRRSC